MPYDLVLRNGTVVDGSGGPPREADVAVEAGVIAAVGDCPSRGREEVDARGCWVTPGFIDPHTHLDAQLCWDASGSPSNRHGVTTVVLGLCGFGVAPCPDGGDEYLLRALEVVEEIPYASTRAGVPFGWRSWREFRDHIAGRPLAVNAAGFVPHSALRYFAMGERARHETAGPADLAAMRAELEDALAAGAVGFATSRGPNHVDGYREPVPSRLADEAELRELVAACRGRLWQINVETKFSHDAGALIQEIERYAQWTRESGARLTWTPFYAEPGETVWQEVLAHNAKLNASGVSVSPQITSVPITLLLRFDERSLFSAINGWQQALKGFFREEPAARLARLADPRTRAAMKSAEPGDPKSPLTADFALWTFTLSPSHPELAGRSVAEAAREAGVHPVDLLCDRVIADRLATLIDVPVLNRSREGAIELLRDPHTLLGLGDSGAHVMTVTNFRYPSFLLGDVVRKGELPVESAVHELTAVPARMHGLAGRGLLEPGAAADLCVVDPDEVGLCPPVVRHDLPGDSPRLDQPGRGYRAVFVNGACTMRDDEPTGATPGRMLRAG